MRYNSFWKKIHYVRVGTVIIYAVEVRMAMKDMKKRKAAGYDG